MTIGTSLYTLCFGKAVGKDGFGNTYYTTKCSKPDTRQKRWVVYHNKADPTTVPAEWHGWLHYRTDATPTEQPRVNYEWVANHTPNYTGTASAYLPSGHPLKGGKTPKASGDYEPWQPN